MLRKIDLKEERKRIAEYISEYIRSASKFSGVLGLSGGVDSALVAALAKEGLGGENVYAVIMPHIAGDPENVVDAVKLAEALDINYEIIDITPYVDQYFWDNEPNASKMRRGNFMARIRMTILFDLSVEYDALVLGTSNRSELLTGYSTQFGDNACAFEPIGHLYKTEVYELSKQMNISKEIIEKIPTADFWQGQTDEEEMKIGYKPLDEILYLLYEKKIPLQEVLEKGYKQEEVERVVQLYNGSAFKRKLPPTIEEI